MKMQTRYLVLAVMMFPLFYASAAAQTCSCAGAPLLSSQSMGTTAKGNLVAGFTIENNVIDHLFTGSDRINDTNQERNTVTGLLELNYGITERLSVSTTITFIRKNRTTGLQTPGLASTLSASGLGDGLMLLKFDVIEPSLWSPWSLAVGGGTKIPFGSTSFTRNGLSLNADMQPGTGAWDGVGWLFASRTFRSTNLTLYSNTSYRRTGTNERFTETDDYRFGNELVSALGLSGPLFNRFSFNLNVKYRSVSSDRRNDETLPNTGGKWLSVRPSVAYGLSDRLSLQVAAERPLFQTLNGTQPTTAHVVSASLMFSFNKGDSGFVRGTSQ